MTFSQRKTSDLPVLPVSTEMPTFFTFTKLMVWKFKKEYVSDQKHSTSTLFQKDSEAYKFIMKFHGVAELCFFKHENLPTPLV